MPHPTAHPPVQAPRRSSRQPVWAPSEEALHRACLQWANLHLGRYPLLHWLIHVPNGGKRPKGEAGKLRAMGTKPGVPDLLLPFPSPSGAWKGLAIEFKSATGKLTPQQKAWLDQMAAAGWKTAVIRSLDEFIDTMHEFLR
ncbi:MAG: VRR-NUC domain-containing protein [Gammaproteobacteria bacterium]|nr:VRR-NUC domain-containing protein [Gammaproteobacteria bacterium]